MEPSPHLSSLPPFPKKNPLFSSRAAAATTHNALPPPSPLPYLFRPPNAIEWRCWLLCPEKGGGGREEETRRGVSKADWQASAASEWKRGGKRTRGLEGTHVAEKMGAGPSPTYASKREHQACHLPWKHLIANLALFFGIFLNVERPRKLKFFGWKADAFLPDGLKKVFSSVFPSLEFEGCSGNSTGEGSGFNHVTSMGDFRGNIQFSLPPLTCT